MRTVFFSLLALLLLTPAAAPAESAADSLTEFARRFAAHADALEESFEIACSGAVADALLAERPEGGENLLSDLSQNCGMLTYAYRRTDGGLLLSKCRYYEGARILHAWRTGDSGFLTARERETLDAAESIVLGISGDEVTRERKVHDALCERVRYRTDDSDGHLERDCAVGALLNGEADCDGYADAFNLLCGMTGLPSRFQHGTAVADEEDILAAPGAHMWNVVRVNGRWVMTDVTWDDRQDGCCYLYFNFGAEETATHRWDACAAVETAIAVADDSLRPADLARAEAADFDGVYECLKSAALRRETRVCLSTAPGFSLLAGRQQFSDLIYAVGASDYRWALSDRGAEVYGLTYAATFALCETEQEVADALDRFAREDARSFRLCFGPRLGPGLLADDCRRARQLIDRSRLTASDFRFSSQSWYIDVANAAYEALREVVNTPEELLACVREGMKNRADSVSVVLGEGLDFEAVSDALAAQIYRMGAYSFTWRISGTRLTVEEIGYYPEFAVVQSVREAADYLASCRLRGAASLVIYFPDALFDELMRNNAEGFFALLRDAGVNSRQFSYSGETASFHLDNIAW